MGSGHGWVLQLPRWCVLGPADWRGYTQACDITTPCCTARYLQVGMPKSLSPAKEDEALKNAFVLALVRG